MAETQETRENRQGLQPGQTAPMGQRREGRDERQLSQTQREGRVARAIETQTARLPSDTFLWAGIASLAFAGYCQMREPRFKRQTGLFIGQLAAPLLLMGLYNKIVKVAGSDRASRQ